MIIQESREMQQSMITRESGKRFYAIDIARGLVMVIMTLDHVRDLLHANAIDQSPTNLATTTPLLFFTRWITHLCAPIFVFLAGTSAYLSFTRKNDVRQSRIFLFKRGLWLVLLEFSIVNVGLFFDLGFHNLLFEVIAAIGVGFILLSLFMKWSAKTIGLIGLLIIFCHNLLPLISFGEGSVLKAFLSPFYSPIGFPVSGGRIFMIGYPPVPWLGIMMVGFATGKFFDWQETPRKRVFLRLAIASLLLFVFLRFLNFYGDPVPWSSQKTMIYTFLSFMNITKYPPSLLYSLVTLGILFLILAFTEGVNNRITAIVRVYGKVPLFYFIVHFYIIHTILLLILFCQGFHWADLNFSSGTFGRPKGKESGIPLWAVYPVWIAVVALLYKPCAWFGHYKAMHKYWWLRYM
ncbi:DUF1624 domain-containing protein [Flavitalea flava]